MRDHPVFARFYERLSVRLNEAGERDHRVELVADARGRVLELGCGNGLNLQEYRRAEEVVALEPEPTMLRLAAGRARTAPVPVRLVRGIAERLPFPDSSFDTVVASLVLCSVTDPARAAAEATRVLRPDGELRYLEHVRSGGPVAALVQDAITPVWQLFSGGCHPNRDPQATLAAAGFTMEAQRFPFGPPSPCRPHVLGVARRPASG